MPALGTQTGKPYTVPTRRARVPRVRKTPPRAPIYVPPASLSSPEARKAAREAKHPKHANVYVPPRSLSSKEARAATRYNVRVHKGEAAGPAAPPRYGIERRTRKAEKREAAKDRAFERRTGTLFGATTTRAERDRTKQVYRDMHPSVSPADVAREAAHQAKLPKPKADEKPKGLGGAIKAITHGDYGGMEVIPSAAKLIGNAGKDAAELAITTPSSLAHLGSESYHVGKDVATGHPAKAWKGTKHIGAEFAEPYKQFAKDPVTFATKHPVTSYLMFAPGVKMPGRLAGKTARIAGKSSLKREAATLPGTSLRETRTAHPDVTARRLPRPKLLQLDKPAGGTISRGELNRRVDEFYDAGQQHKQSATASAAKVANKRHGKVADKAERAQLIETHLSGARGGAHQHVERQFAREFGSHWQVHPDSGGIVKPKNPKEGSGVIHATREDAQRVADAIERSGHFDPKVMELEGATPGETSGFAVVPTEAAQRLGKHKAVGSSPAVGAITGRVASRAFRKTVLPTSTKWLGGQVGEAALRAAVHGAGPLSYLRGRMILKAIEREHGKPVADQVRARTTQGGQFSVTGPAAEFAGKPKTLAEQFSAHEGTRVGNLAQKATDIGAKPGARHARGAYRRYSEFVFNKVNAPIEEMAKTAMLGKAAKTGPLMEKRMIGLGEKAVKEAADGLTNTSAQVELGRAIDRAYGRYSKFSPAARETIAHSTPFVPWFINMGHFLTQVLPRDHPLKAGLMASYSEATKEWRKQHRLSLYGDHVPEFMLGSAPSGKKFVPFGRFAPFLPGDPVSAAGGQFLPQFAGTMMNLAGADWKGDKIPGGPGRHGVNAALTLAETFMPLLSQADRVTGLGDRYVRGKVKKQSVAQGKDIPQALLDLVNPIKAIGAPSDKHKAKPKAGGWAGPSGSSGWGGSGWGGG
jgi:hypothetical protein